MSSFRCHAGLSVGRLWCFGAFDVSHELEISPTARYVTLKIFTALGDHDCNEALAQSPGER